MLKFILALTFVSLSMAAVQVEAKDWAVIVAGSSTFENYRHQSDACHAYQLVHSNGIPPENIVTFMYDDIAKDPANPFTGQIFNAPTEKGKKGIDVYDSIQKDYTGSSVTPGIFLAVLTGNSSFPGATKVLQSTVDDRIFIYFADHGAAGLVAFPMEYLYATDLIAALKQMFEQKTYARIVFYMEACESGSMFDGLLPADWRIYATTAANPSESSWANYCPPDDLVDGVHVGACLGDLYSTNWMENSDQVGPSESLGQQFTIVRNETAGSSHVMRYGDVAYTKEATGDFMGEGANGKRETTERDAASTPSVSSSSRVSSRDVGVHTAYYRYLRAARFSDESTTALAALRAHLDARELAEQRFTALTIELATNANGDVAVDEAAKLFDTPSAPVHSGACVKGAVEALRANGCDYSDHSLQFHVVIVNACRRYDTEESGAQALRAAIEKVCA